MTREVPPEEISGKVMPVTGSSVDDIADVDQRLRGQPHDTVVAAISWTKLVLGPAGNAQAGIHEQAEQQEHERAADQPEFLADDRENVVGVRVRQ